MKKKLSLSVLCFALFIALIAVVSTVDVAAIGPEETKIGLSHLNRAVHDTLGVNMGLYKITQYLGYYGRTLTKTLQIDFSDRTEDNEMGTVVGIEIGER